MIQLRWAFSLYDLDGDGVLTKSELTRIVVAIYDLMGRVDPYTEELAAREHVDKVFQVIAITLPHRANRATDVETGHQSERRDHNGRVSRRVFEGKCIE